MIQLMQDGNFRVEHLLSKVSKDDVRLSDGLGYMVESTAYKRFLQETDEVKQPVSYPFAGSTSTLASS